MCTHCIAKNSSDNSHRYYFHLSSVFFHHLVLCFLSETGKFAIYVAGFAKREEWLSDFGDVYIDGSPKSSTALRNSGILTIPFLLVIYKEGFNFNGRDLKNKKR